ncbi:hypothetical protein HPP92_016345 [Vanilla planifolia]|uniref:Uncharacterized protein n=1 Tax=Vanilla planifolia TaxID=51239 RepID=A0A835QFX3_VANPL|nr:hypothetical protein HPP92_016345 [Vanilla planifolia]
MGYGLLLRSIEMNPLTLVKRIQKINSTEAALGISEDASWHAKYKDSAYVFVGGIPFDLTEGDLLAVFAEYGEVVDVNLVRDKATGKSRGFAFLAYEDQRSTILAVEKEEEEDEETEKAMREARGVCLAFQRGECNRGSACKFSHDAERHANTGWGTKDSDSRWGHDKFDGSKRHQNSSHAKAMDDDRKPRFPDKDRRHAEAEIDKEIDRKQDRLRLKDHKGEETDELHERPRYEARHRSHKDMKDRLSDRDTQEKAFGGYRTERKEKQHRDVEDFKRQKSKHDWLDEANGRGGNMKHSRDDKDSSNQRHRDDDRGRSSRK